MSPVESSIYRLYGEQGLRDYKELLSQGYSSDEAICIILNQ